MKTSKTSKKKKPNTITYLEKIYKDRSINELLKELKITQGNRSKVSAVFNPNDKIRAIQNSLHSRGIYSY